MTHNLRAELPEMPDRMKSLPVDERGYPVPWFVSWIDGKPEFRAADARKLLLAIKERRCWVCGRVLGTYYSFVIGPMCAVNRLSSEPPSHHECATFSARACPFLSMPKMKRREKDLPDGIQDPAGHSLKRNPGVSLVWTSKTFVVERYEEGFLFRLGDPHSLEIYAEGRPATIEEIRASFDSGCPNLAVMAKAEGRGAEMALAAATKTARQLLGI